MLTFHVRPSSSFLFLVNLRYVHLKVEMTAEKRPFSGEMLPATGSQMAVTRDKHSVTSVGGFSTYCATANYMLPFAEIPVMIEIYLFTQITG